MAFRIGFQAAAYRLNGCLLADAGEDILQGSARWMVIQHFIGRQQRHAGHLGNLAKPRETAPVIAPVQYARCKPYALCETALQSAQNIKRLLELETMRQSQDKKLPFGKLNEVIQF